MKCPYRIETKIYGTATEEYFMDCYAHECPFYEPEVKIGNAIITASCARVIVEKKKGGDGE